MHHIDDSARRQVDLEGSRWSIKLLSVLPLRVCLIKFFIIIWQLPLFILWFLDSFRGWCYHPRFIKFVPLTCVLRRLLTKNFLCWSLGTHLRWSPTLFVRIRHNRCRPVVDLSFFWWFHGNNSLWSWRGYYLLDVSFLWWSCLYRPHNVLKHLSCRVSFSQFINK